MRGTNLLFSLNTRHGASGDGFEQSKGMQLFNRRRVNMIIVRFYLVLF